MRPPIVADFENDDRALLDPDDYAEEAWEPLVLAARKGDLAPLVGHLLDAGVGWKDLPPRARAALAALLARNPGRPPRYGRAPALQAAHKRRGRLLEDQLRRADYERHLAQLKVEKKRKRGLREEAIRRAAEERCPGHPGVEAAKIDNVLRRAKKPT